MRALTDKQIEKFFTENPKRKKFVAKLVTHLAKEWLAIGELDEKDLQNRDLLFKKMKKLAKGQIDIVLDHRQSILKEAKKYEESKEYDFSKIFYAMFFEHHLNSIISSQCFKMKLSDQTRLKLIKASMYDKMEWVCEVLKLPNFNKSHADVILNLADKRNSFMHYKLKPIEDNFEKEEADKLIEMHFFQKIKKTVKYMKAYESKIQFQGKKKVRLKNLKSVLSGVYD